MSSLRVLARNLVKRVLARFSYRITRLDNPDVFETLLHRILLAKGQISFVQIGANDGIRFDPIHAFVKAHRHRVSGVVVEPLPDLFAALKANYEDCPNVVPVNAAIHNVERSMALYRVDPQRARGLPDWIHGIASFDRGHLARHSTIPSEAIVEVEVQCVSLGELLRTHRITDLDVLLIDTEGYDAEIIRSLPFDAVRPRVVRFEHGYPAGIMDRTTFESVLGLLHSAGYEVLVELEDATAYDRYLFLERWQEGGRTELPDHQSRDR